jgi:hypothetical protein
MRREKKMRDTALQPIADALRSGELSLEEILRSKSLPSAILRDFVGACVGEILSRGGFTREAMVRLRRLKEKYPCFKEAQQQENTDEAWLKQICIAAQCSFGKLDDCEESEEEELYAYIDEDIEILASDISELEAMLAARQAIRSRQGVGRPIEEWYAARSATRIRQLHILATLIDMHQQLRLSFCRLLRWRLQSLQGSLRQRYQMLEEHLFSREGECHEERFLLEKQKILFEQLLSPTTG